MSAPITKRADQLRPGDRMLHWPESDTWNDEPMNPDGCMDTISSIEPNNRGLRVIGWDTEDNDQYSVIHANDERIQGPRMTPSPTFTAAGSRAATELFQSDWDADGAISIDLPAAIATALLEARGFYRDETRRSRLWTAPSGEQFGDRQEALSHALAAEALS